MCHTHPLKATAWHLLNETAPLDCIYFGKVFKQIEKDLKSNNIIFYLTWNIDELPSYGPNVVAVVVGDEKCRVPKYFNKVKAIYKCYGIYPMLEYDFIISPSYLNLMKFLLFLRNYFSGLPRLITYLLHKLKERLFHNIPISYIYDIPLGYFNQIEVPIVNIKNRKYDIFFAGGIQLKSTLIFGLESPKTLSRNEMLSNIDKIKQNSPEINVEVVIKDGFKILQEEKRTEAVLYSQKLMNSKICVVPRGNSCETFRFFEALRVGCIIITEKLPSRWFYNKAPYIQINNWGELDKVISNLFEDKDYMEKMHLEALKWWESKCSEVAVGKHIAENLNLIL